MNKLKENVPGLIMVVLGLFGMIYEVSNVFDLPAWADIAIGTVERLLLFMGIRDMIDEKKEALLARLVDLKSKTFWGILASSNLTTLLFNAEMIPGAGIEIQSLLTQIGALAAGWGLIEAGKRGKTVN